MIDLIRQRPSILWVLLALNILLSYWAYIADPVINNDGVLYVSLARIGLLGDWPTVFTSYDWPLYSGIIAGVSAVTGMSAESAAYCLNAALIILLAAAFTAIVGELSDYDHRTMVIALVVVVLFPSISKYRSFIVRDFAYLSCYLWSLFFLIRFCQQPNKISLIAWLALTLIACLFRFEAVAFVLVAPYLLFHFSGDVLKHRRIVLLTISLGLLVGVFTALILYTQQKYAASIAVAKQAGLEISSLQDLVFYNLSARFGQEINSYSALFTVVAGTISDVSYELVRRMAVVYLVFVLIAIYAGYALKHALLRRVWLIYVVTNLLVLVAFALVNSFIVSRYLMATALTLLLLAPFTIVALLARWQVAALGQKMLISLAFLVIVVAALDGLNTITRKQHIRTAGEWMQTNIPADARVYSNSRIAMYYRNIDPYLNLTEEYSSLRLQHYLNQNTLNRFDYVAIALNPTFALEVELAERLMQRYGPALASAEGPDGRALIIFNTATADKTTMERSSNLR